MNDALIRRVPQAKAVALVSPEEEVKHENRAQEAEEEEKSAEW